MSKKSNDQTSYNNENRNRPITESGNYHRQNHDSGNVAKKTTSSTAGNKPPKQR